MPSAAEAEGRARSAFALILLDDEYLLGSLRFSVQRALFFRVSAAAKLSALPRHDIPAYLNWPINQVGLDRDIFAPASIDLLAEASDAVPRTLNLLAQSARFIAARAATSSIHPDHIHQANKLVPSVYAKISHPRPDSTPAAAAPGHPTLRPQPLFFALATRAKIDKTVRTSPTKLKSPHFIPNNSPVLIAARHMLIAAISGGIV